MFGYPFVPAVFILVAAALLYYTFRNDWPNSFYGLLVILYGVPVFAGFRGRPAWMHLLFSFDGRIARLKFWGYHIAYALLYVLCLVLASKYELPYLPLAYLLLTVYPTLAVNVKRCHDRGRSGWFVLVGAIPVLGFWFLVEAGFLPGTTGENEYGPDPAR